MAYREVLYNNCRIIRDDGSVEVVYKRVVLSNDSKVGVIVR